MEYNIFIIMNSSIKLSSPLYFKNALYEELILVSIVLLDINGTVFLSTCPFFGLTDLNLRVNAIIYMHTWSFL